MPRSGPHGRAPPGTVTYNNQTFVPEGGPPLPDGAIVDVSIGRGIELTDRNGNARSSSGEGRRPEQVRGQLDRRADRARAYWWQIHRPRALHASDAKKKPVRRLWGKGKGNFRTRGRLASATVRGTWWVTADFRDYTLISVREGSLTVRDFVKRKTVIVRAGGSYKAFKKR